MTGCWSDRTCDTLHASLAQDTLYINRTLSTSSTGHSLHRQELRTLSWRRVSWRTPPPTPALLVIGMGPQQVAAPFFVALSLSGLASTTVEAVYVWKRCESQPATGTPDCPGRLGSARRRRPAARRYALFCHCAPHAGAKRPAATVASLGTMRSSAQAGGPAGGRKGGGGAALLGVPRHLTPYGSRVDLGR